MLSIPNFISIDIVNVLSSFNILKLVKNKFKAFTNADNISLTSICIKI